MKDGEIILGGADGYSDTAEFTIYGGGLTVTVDNPWAGDTETGFGQTTSARLNEDEVKKLIEFLSAAMGYDPNPYASQKG